MSELEIESANKIKKYWQIRTIKKKVMQDLLSDLYDRYLKAYDTFLLIDDMLDENIFTLLECYDRRATRLYLTSFETYQILRSTPYD